MNCAEFLIIFFSKIVDELKILNVSSYKIDNTKGEFSCVLKHADVIPVHKKEIKSDKVNYRPVSILPNLSKIYEKVMYQQLYEHFDSILSPKQCGFPKGYSAQHCLGYAREIERIER